MKVIILILMVTSSFCFGEDNIFQLIKDDNVERIAELVESGELSPHATDLAGFSLLHDAVRFGSKKVAQYLIDSNVNIEGSTINGLQPIHIAAINDDSEMLQFLIDNGASIEGADENNLTAMHWASRYGNINAMNTLYDNGANVDALSKNNWSPLHFAAFHAEEEATQTLIDDMSANTQLANSLGYLPIHLTMHPVQQNVTSEAKTPKAIHLRKYYTISPQKADAYMNIENILLEFLKSLTPAATIPET